MSVEHHWGWRGQRAKCLIRCVSQECGTAMHTFTFNYVFSRKCETSFFTFKMLTLFEIPSLLTIAPKRSFGTYFTIKMLRFPRLCCSLFLFKSRLIILLLVFNLVAKVSYGNQGNGPSNNVTNCRATRWIGLSILDRTMGDSM